MKLFSILQRVSLTLLLLFTIATTAQASHVMGADLTYDYLGSNQYKIRLKLFRDCNGIYPSNAVSINISSVSGGTSQSVVISQVGTETDITGLCATAITACTGGSGASAFGLQQWIYEGNVTLSTPRPDYKFSFELCCRNNAITNLSNPSNQELNVNAFLNSSLAPTNSSPDFLIAPVLFVYNNQAVNISHGGFDVDGDSLAYSLVACKKAGGTNCTYAAPFSGTVPFSSSVATSISATNGTISFTPNLTQVAVFAVKVDEYRKFSGVFQKIGEVNRDMQITIINGANANPNIGGINGTAATSITIPSGVNTCFTIDASDANASNIITNTWNNSVAGATLTSNAAGTLATFCWTPPFSAAGTHTIVVTSKDDNCPLPGSKTKTFLINVLPCDVPTITCPANISENISSGACTKVVTYATITTGTAPVDITYSFAGATTGSGTGDGSGSTFAIGTTTVTLTATNSCGAPSCSFTITVVDNIAPIMPCPTAITLVVTSASSPALLSAFPPSATDNCSTPMVVQTGGVVNGSYLPIGSYTMQWTATDASGNTTVCNQAIAVVDGIAPMLTCPVDIATQNDVNICGALVNYTVPTYTISSTCPTPNSIAGFSLLGVHNGHKYFLSNASDSWTNAKNAAIALGGHLVSVNNAAENAFVQTATVIASNIWLGGSDIAIEGTFVWNNGDAFTYTNWDPGEPNSAGGNQDELQMYTNGNWDDVEGITLRYVVEFDCAYGTLTQTAGLPSGSIFPTGTTINTYAISNSTGVIGSCSFTVSVADTAKPTIVCNANIAVNNDVGVCGAVVNFVPPGCGTVNLKTQIGNNLENGLRGLSANSFNVDNLIVPSNTCWIVDSINIPYFINPFIGLTATGFTIRIFDDNAGIPGVLLETKVITLASLITTTNIGSNFGYNVLLHQFKLPTALTSLCAGAVAKTFWFSIKENVPDYNINNYFWETSSNGIYGNDGGITTNGSYISGINATGSGANGNFVFSMYQNQGNGVSDNCTTCPTVIQTAGLASGSVYPIGTTANTFKATDASGNFSTCSFNVVVSDNQNPVITCSTTFTATANNAGCTYLGSIGTATATDNCSVTSITALPAGPYPIGNTTVTYKATDASGNFSTCTQLVTITAQNVIVVNNSIMPLYTNDVVNLLITSPIGGSSYAWAGPGGLSSNTDDIIETVSSANSGVYTASVIDAIGCNISTTISINVNASIVVNVKAILSGPYITSAGLMQDSLRIKNMIPTIEPYGALPYSPIFTHASNSNIGMACTNPSLLNNTSVITDSNAIVDWVFLQVRDASDATNVLASRSALLKRNGNVVREDGVSPVTFQGIAPGNYFISIKHRTHLGLMSDAYLALSETPTLIDYTNASATYFSRASPNNNASPLTGASRIMGGKRAMYTGNCNIGTTAWSRFITYNNTLNSDRTSLVAQTGSSGTVIGYSIFDIDMNGYARFNGLNPDRLVMLLNCAGSSTLYVNEQTPN
jgi:Lectin C-type domain/HYR domain